MVSSINSVNDKVYNYGPSRTAKTVLGVGLLGGGVYLGDQFYRTKVGKKTSDGLGKFFVETGKEIGQRFSKFFTKSKENVVNGVKNINLKEGFKNSGENITKNSKGFTKWFKELPPFLKVVGIAGITLMTGNAIVKGVRANKLQSGEANPMSGNASNSEDATMNWILSKVDRIA